MPSPASSYPVVAGRHLLLLLGTIVGILVVAELVSRRVIVRSSKIEQRIAAEGAAAPGIRKDSSVLLLGNSLMLYALRDSSLAALVPSGWTARRYVVEQTGFLDWKYAIEELWRRGARPAVVVLMLDPGQLTTRVNRGDYTAFRLLGASDLIPFGRDAGLHPTDISKLVLSHFSTFYGFRAEMRKVLLSRLVPGMQHLTAAILVAPSNPVDAALTGRIAEERLRELRTIATSHGASFIFVLPPREGASASVDAVVNAAREIGVRVIAPDSRRPYRESDFFDGYHVSAAGAKRFESEFRIALARLLRPSIKHDASVR